VTERATSPNLKTDRHFHTLANLVSQVNSNDLVAIRDIF
jgi:hypothetical protein